jgi:hypothetical protein
MDNIIPLWNLHFVLEMLAQRSRLNLTFCNRLIDDFFDKFNTCYLHKFNLTQDLKTSWHCSLLLIKCVFKGCYGCCVYLRSMRGIWYQSNLLTYTYLVCGQGTLVDNNSKNFNLLSNIVYERLTISSCFLLNLSLPSIGWLTTMVTGTSIVKV